MLIPTELAMNLIKLLEEHGEWLINIEHTEQFEKQLDEIEEGEDPNKLIFEYDKLKDEFLDKLGFYYRKDNEPPQWLLDKVHGIAEKTGEVLPDSILKDATKIKKFISDFEKTTTLGKCPECKKSEVHEREKTFSCNNVACDFTIWKNGIGSFFNNFNKYMPECAYKDLIKHLIKNKMIWFEDLYSKKQEKNFAAYVVLEKNNKSFQLSLSFPRSKVKTIDEKYMFDTKTFEEMEKDIVSTPKKAIKIEPVVFEEKKAEIEAISNTAINEIQTTNNEELLKDKIKELENEKRFLLDENDKDKLTRVFNRGKLEKDLKNLWESSYQDITFGFIDFDKFKNINDSYGHQAGDEVLKKSIDMIYKIVRNFDIKVYRYGGEEFCIVSEEEKSLTREIFESIRTNIKKIKFNFNNTPVTVTISIGISFRDKEEDYESLIKRADEMVYKAKENGRDRIEISVFKEEEEIIW
jgi:diguanylate cyclase (GGDEF)-like protein